jgi:hypothetical protein
LKATLTKLFDQHGSVGKAYLVRVTYDEAPETSVALCLASATPTDAPLVDGIRKVFANQFQTGSHLDILFVSASEVPRLERTSAPFYTRALHA